MTLVSHVTLSDPATQSWLAAVSRRMQMLGGTAAEAQLRADRLLERVVSGQAAMLAYEKVFLLMGLTLSASCILLLALRTGRASGGGGAAH